MYNHAPQDYVCPLCLLGKEEYKEPLVVVPDDVVYKTEYITAFISSRWWPNNKGHIIVIPNEHFENLYDIDIKYLHEVVEASQKLAIAIKKAYKCDGITIRQHNEPAGSQDAWHYHMHVVPRYTNDNFYKTDAIEGWIDPAERKSYAMLIKKELYL